MSTARYLVGDVFEMLATIPDDSVDLVVTSPPFLALRNYLPPDHPDKAHEIGSEGSPGEFLDRLLDVTEQLRRVLAPHGSLVVELGDTYSGSGGAGGDYNPDGLRAGQNKFDGSNHRRGRIVDHDSGRRNPGPGWPLDKSLAMIPESYRWALAYGRNPFTGRETPRWRIRNTMPWSRANPAVGELIDKWRPATSYAAVACVGKRRYCDLDAVRTAHLDTGPRTTNGPKNAAADTDEVMTHYDTRTTNAAGAPPLDWWNDVTDGLRSYFATLGDDKPSPTKAVQHLRDLGALDLGDHLLVNAEGYRGAHYAVFPPRFVEPFVKALCPLRVCTECGKPSERIVERGHVDADSGEAVELEGGDMYATDTPRETRGRVARNGEHARVIASSRTLGWTDCGHDSWRNGLTLDPFAGSGTTLQVAQGLGRDSLGIDLDERNADLAQERLGLFLAVERVVDVQTGGRV